MSITGVVVDTLDLGNDIGVYRTPARQSAGHTHFDFNT
jgi:hypothetical protein